MLLQSLIIVIAIGLIYWILRIKKNKLFRRHSRPQKVITNIEGNEVRTFLGLQTPLTCLKDDGFRFGKSFRVKTAPTLPHNEDCQCKILSIAYASTDIFETEPPTRKGYESFVGELSYQEAQVLKRILIGLHTRPLPLEFEVFCQQLGLDQLSEEVRSKARPLVQQNFDQYHQNISTEPLPFNEKSVHSPPSRREST
ncbi:hypothetical protein WDW89_17525 [Deltaproteobacteria bacterium TL4]